MSNDKIPLIEEVAKGKQRSLDDVSVKDLPTESQSPDNYIKKGTHHTRIALIWFLSGVTLVWLIFTAVVVLLLGFRYNCFELTDTVVVAFLTTSLGTVLALLTIGLKFYFGKEK